MAKLLMITGLGSAEDLASGKKGAFYNTLEEFHKYWDRIDIISPKLKGYKSETKKLFGNVYIHVSPWPLIFHPIWFIKKGLEIYKEEKFDLMTVHEFPPFYNGIGARLLWQKIKVPYVLEIHHIPGYPKAGNIKEKMYRKLMSMFIRFDAKRAKAVRVVNQKETPNFLIKAGVPADKIIYIPSAYIDLSVFKPMDLPKKYDLIFVGRLVENKGINLFVEAVKQLNVKALIVGDGPLYDKIKFEIINSKLEIKLHGWAKDSLEVAELINKSKILVMPSYNEGGPRVVVEAMACGVPVLATPVGIVPDLLKNGPDTHENSGGAIEDPRFANHALHEANRDRGGEIIAWEPEDIAKKARGLLNDPARYNKISGEAIEIAKQFEKKSAIKNYADKLKSIL